MDETLANRLKLPLKQTQISQVSMVFTDHRLPSGGAPPEKLITGKADWSPGWQLSDEIIDATECIDHK